MEQETFKAILDRYLEGTCSEEEKARVEEWYERLGKDKPLMVANEQQIESRLMTQLQERMGKPNVFGETESSNTRLWSKMAVAAMITFAIAASVYALFWSDTKLGRNANQALASEHGLTEIKNTNTSNKDVTLPDGSVITLHKNSSIKFNPEFNATEREVYLEGEAFFNIHRDTKRPFFVYAQDVVTKVLGTSFTVTAFERHDSVTVKVKTGKVLVYTLENQLASGKTENMLIPNQQITYSRNNKSVSKSIVAAPESVVPLNAVKRIRFEGAPVSEILRALEEIYSVKIEFNETTFASCKLTTTVSDGGFYERLDIICRAINATYKVEEDKIRIVGSGCD